MPGGGERAVPRPAGALPAASRLGPRAGPADVSPGCSASAAPGAPEGSGGVGPLADPGGCAPQRLGRSPGCSQGAAAPATAAPGGARPRRSGAGDGRAGAARRPRAWRRPRARTRAPAPAGTPARRRRAGRRLPRARRPWPRPPARWSPPARGESAGSWAGVGGRGGRAQPGHARHHGAGRDADAHAPPVDLDARAAAGTPAAPRARRRPGRGPAARRWPPPRPRRRRGSRPSGPRGPARRRARRRRAAAGPPRPGRRLADVGARAHTAAPGTPPTSGSWPGGPRGRRWGPRCGP